MPDRDFSALNASLARVANQRDPSSPFGIGGAGIAPQAPIPNSLIGPLQAIFERTQQVRENINPDLVAAQRQAAVQRFQNRRDPVAPQTQVTPDGASPLLTNRGGPMTELRQGAERFQDPNFQQAMQAQSQQGLMSAINTNPQVVSSLLANQRAQQNNQARAQMATQAQQAARELAELNQRAATGRTALTQGELNRRFQLQAFLESLKFQSGMATDFPTTFGFGGPPEDLAQQFGDFQGAVGGFQTTPQINTGPQVPQTPQVQPTGAGQFQLNQEIPTPNGTFRVVGFAPDGEPLVELVQ